jgi:hypothetical protein
MLPSMKLDQLVAFGVRPGKEGSGLRAGFPRFAPVF